MIEASTKLKDYPERANEKEERRRRRREGGGGGEGEEGSRPLLLSQGG